ncbi:MAG: pitrilysin family protein [Persephonella sp.]|nr:pitrilysin family protein [Persephonella sp.]
MRKIIFMVVVVMGSLAYAGDMIKNVYIEKLDNGVTAIVKERKDTQAVAIQVWFGVGSVFEKDNERGLSHFLEHMLFNGTKYTRPGEIEKKIEEKGGSINAGTSTDFTFYHIEIASPFWEESLQYLYYMTTAPSLTEKMIQKEKPIVLEELNRHLDNPKSVLWDTYNKLAYRVSNYRHPVIGYRETIEKFSQKLVRDYFYSHYVPSNTYVVVVGNVNRKKVLRKIKETFGTVEGQYYRPEKVPLEPPQKEIRRKIIKKSQITRAYVAIGWQAPSINSKDSFTANVLEEIFTGGRTLRSVSETQRNRSCSGCLRRVSIPQRHRSVSVLLRYTTIKG